MSGVVYLGGGFGTGLDRMSPGLAARVAAADADYDRQSARQERDAQALRAMVEEDRIALSIRMAQDRGEAVDVLQAIRAGGIGRTRVEAITQASAQADAEDARQVAAERAAFRRWQAQQSASTSADLSAPTATEVAEFGQIKARAETYRAKRREEGRLLTRGRRLARMDRGTR